MGLRYTGVGFLPDVPARDLTDEEADLFGAPHGGRAALVRSGAYEAKLAEQPSKRATKIAGPAEDKSAAPNEEGA